MKFAKELNQDLVPEWRLKYMDYKGGKKRIKDIARALAKINQTPRIARWQQRGNAHTPFKLFNNIDEAGLRTPPEARETLAEQLLRAQTADRETRRRADLTRVGTTGSERAEDGETGAGRLQSTKRSGMGSEGSVQEREPGRRTNRSSRGKGKIGERSPLRIEVGADDEAGSTTYGSILANPAIRSAPVGPPSLELPDPALSLSDPLLRAVTGLEQDGDGSSLRRTASVSGDAYEIGRTHTPSKASVGKLPRRRNIFHPRRTFSTPYGAPNIRRPFYQRFFSGHHKADSPRNPDIQLDAYGDFDLAQARFFNFLDKELNKIEVFYKTKEEEAIDRLEKLHEQLRIMRDRRVHELLAAQHFEVEQHDEDHHHHRHHHDADAKEHKRPSLVPLDSVTLESGRDWLRPLENAVGLGNSHVGKNSKALQQMVLAKQQELDPNQPQDQSWRDYSRRPIAEHVPYRIAKRKLKLALQEYYRGLELLKSYALLNRTAFRKINKKYDKAVTARPPYRYMSERVNKAWFVVSERLERLIVETEDLYTRYFERGNHKIAVSKLRSKADRGSHSSSVFRNGLMSAAGMSLGIQGTINGFYINTDPSDIVRGQWASYLLQLYGGYTLALLLFLLFALDCRQWTRSKINYVFIFEFDTRHNLDWRQLSELPCFFVLLLGLVMFLNFHPSTPYQFFLWWPVVLIGVTLLILFFPARVFYWRSRGWLLYSIWRLFFAGIYSVEFRDFFLGDMFCSLTYSMQNIEVFFCLYATSWSDPEICNSSHSRLLGFFSTLPGIWRALQCIRRYHDTRNVFPHLVNCGKYSCTILFYMCLSLYRIDRNFEYYVLFLFFGSLNSIYVSAWDLVMDWSLCNPYAPHFLLRNDLGYKSTKFYYTAMLIDPILRFNWLLYVVLPVELQHSALLSFLISVSEVSRRAMWTLIRVENEHCTNVGRFRASRDVPLPYELFDDKPVTPELVPNQIPAGSKLQVGTTAGPKPSNVSADTAPPQEAVATTDSLHPTSSSVSRPSPSMLRRRQTLPGGTLEGGGLDSPRRLNRVGTMLATAHAQDFERRKKPGGTFAGMDGSPVPSEPRGGLVDDEASSDDEEEEPQAESARLLGAREHDERKERQKDIEREREREHARESPRHRQLENLKDAVHGGISESVAESSGDASQ